MGRKKKAVILILAALMLLVLGFALGSATAEPDIQVQNGLRLEVVKTLSQQEKGLSGRAEIPDNYGMLFVFPTKGRYGFWMKDMLVPIDIIWLADDGTILKIDAHADPSSYPEPFYPPEPVRYVLETRAGFAQVMGWKEGSVFALPTDL